MANFEVVSKYKDCDIDLIPKRATSKSAGYDMVAAEEVIIPGALDILAIAEDKGLRYIENRFNKDKAKDDSLELEDYNISLDLNETADFTKQIKCRPTLISTGVKCALNDNQYLKLVSRSSMPLKCWILCANSEGIIDADYWNNSSNEGEIYFQCINLAPWPIRIHKGDKICQGIICTYETVENDTCGGLRTGGFGSTDSGATSA